MEVQPRRSAASAEAAASDTLARWYEAWNAHDVDAISTLMVDDVRYEDPAAPSPLMHGRVAVVRYVSDAFAGIPDLHLEKLEEWVTPGGDVIASYFRFSGTFTAELSAPAFRRWARPVVASRCSAWTAVRSVTGASRGIRSSGT